MRILVVNPNTNPRDHPNDGRGGPLGPIDWPRRPR